MYICMVNNSDMIRSTFNLIFSTFVLLLTLSSCVNEEYGPTYDKVLSGDVDMNVNVLKNISLPLGSFEKVLLKDILELTEDISMIEIGENGDISLCIRNIDQELTQTFAVPSFVFADVFEGIDVQEPLGSFDFVYDPAFDMLEEELAKPRQMPDILIDVELVNNALPEIVKEIGYVELNTVAEIGLSVVADRTLPLHAYLAEGTKVTLPEWIEIGQMDSRFEIVDNTITLVEPLRCDVSSASDRDDILIKVPIIGIDTRKLGSGQGILPDGTFYIKDMIVISGSTYFDITATDKVSLGRVSPFINAYAQFSELDIKSIEVVLKDLDKETLGTVEPVYINSLPAFMYASGLVMDVNAIRLDLEFSNTSPFSGEVSVAISSWTGNERLAEIDINSLGFNAGSLSSPEVIRWSFVDAPAPLQVPDGYTYIELDGMTDMVKAVPERIEFNDIYLELDDDYVSVVPGEEYVLSEKFAIYSPLAFGEEFMLPYSYEIDDLGLSFTEADFTSARLEVDVESTVPMDFNAEVVALDENGNIIEGLELRIKDELLLKAGSLESPTSSHLVFEFVNSTGTIDIDGFEINFMASAPEAQFVGIPLNINQGLHFTNVVLTLPEGVFIDVSEF